MPSVIQLHPFFDAVRQFEGAHTPDEKQSAVHNMIAHGMDAFASRGNADPMRDVQNHTLKALRNLPEETRQIVTIVRRGVEAKNLLAMGPVQNQNFVNAIHDMALYIEAETNPDYRATAAHVLADSSSGPSAAPLLKYADFISNEQVMFTMPVVSRTSAPIQRPR